MVANLHNNLHLVAKILFNVNKNFSLIASFRLLRPYIRHPLIPISFASTGITGSIGLTAPNPSVSPPQALQPLWALSNPTVVNPNRSFLQYYVVSKN